MPAPLDSIRPDSSAFIRQARHRGHPWASALVLAFLVFLGVAAACSRSRAPVATPTPMPTATPRPTLTPTPVPTPRCVEPSLLLGDTRMVIDTLAPAIDGSLPVPPDTAGTAFWVAGTNVLYLFALSPSPGNLSLLTGLRAGDPAVITWADCMTDTYEVATVSAGEPDAASLMDQSGGGLSIYAVDSARASGMVVEAVRPSAEPVQTPEAGDEEGLLFDLALGDTTIFADKATVMLSITITNVGAQAFSLTLDDLSLGPDGGETAAPLSVEPDLPHEIQPGADAAFLIAFPHPGTPVAVLTVLDLTLELYY
ncbi:MAG: hypothetical protein ACYCYF_00835 [Anaerolineae bacterium]